ncbi:hypothetical protein BDV98DRAFT_651954 [Pterulicium gracile]|uniref:NmrA-like domain-containing protein n=1 Tax=Pterulicium gracile TaxID=1884261 RepID=A0A5C3Q565_9AGAR|nr:hypothetical protein BDV98DRAFT_651954 [Pterula gracilis]
MADALKNGCMARWLRLTEVVAHITFHGILATDAFNVEALVRPSSSQKPEVEALRQLGIPIRLADAAGSFDDLVDALTGVDIFISAIGATDQLEQLKLADAVKAAKVKRFIPCGFSAVGPVGNVMSLRDKKEEVYNHIKRLRVPFTISAPRIPSGKLDAACTRGGDAPNIITDLWDIGVLVAQIIQDDRTLNQYVVTIDEVLSQNEINATVEQVTGERRLKKAREISAADPRDTKKQLEVIAIEYIHSKYVRGDNSPAYAKYLGYLDSRELYPGVKTRSFRDYVADALGGKEGKLYRHRPSSE